MGRQLRAVGVVAALLLPAACTAEPAAAPATTASPLAPAAPAVPAPDCRAFVDLAIAYHGLVEAPEGLPAAQQQQLMADWRSRLDALGPAADTTLDAALDVLASSSDHVAEQQVDAAAVEACGLPVFDLRPEPFAGVPDPSAVVVVSTGGEIDAVDPVTGETVAVIGPSLRRGVMGRAEVTEGGDVYFLEELTEFAATEHVTAIWRVPLAGGPYELVVLDARLIGDLHVSSDGWLSFDGTFRDDRGGGTAGPGVPTGIWLDGHRLVAPADRDGRSGVAVYDDPEDLDALHAPDGGRFLSPPTAASWFPVTTTPEGALVVAERQGESVRQVVVDPETGAVVAALPDGPFVVDYSGDGSHTLALGAAATDCDHVCPSALFVDGRALDVHVISAAWA